MSEKKDLYELTDELGECSKIFEPYIVDREFIYDEKIGDIVTIIHLAEDAPKEAIRARDRSHEIVTSPFFDSIR